jgi:hypothetical protein
MMPDWRAEARARLDARRFPTPKLEAEPYPVSDSLQERLVRQRAIFRGAADQDPEFHVTLKFNDCLDQNQVYKRLRRFDALLDHFFLGKNWARFASADRTFFIAFIEQDCTIPNNRDRVGVHAHLLLRNPA